MCYFHRETKTDYAPTLFVQLRISRELHVGLLKKKKEPEGVRFNIRGFFFLVIIPLNKPVVRTNQGVDDCAAGGFLIFSCRNKTTQLLGSLLIG